MKFRHGDWVKPKENEAVLVNKDNICIGDGEALISGYPESELRIATMEEILKANKGIEPLKVGVCYSMYGITGYDRTALADGDQITITGAGINFYSYVRFPQGGGFSEWGDKLYFGCLMQQYCHKTIADIIPSYVMVTADYGGIKAGTYHKVNLEMRNDHNYVLEGGVGSVPLSHARAASRQEFERGQTVLVKDVAVKEVEKKIRVGDYVRIIKDGTYMGNYYTAGQVWQVKEVHTENVITAVRHGSEVKLAIRATGSFIKECELTDKREEILQFIPFASDDIVYIRETLASYYTPRMREMQGGYYRVEDIRAPKVYVNGYLFDPEDLTLAIGCRVNHQVRIIRMVPKGQEGSDTSWVDLMDKYISKVVKVTAKGPTWFTAEGWRFPYSCIQHGVLYGVPKKQEDVQTVVYDGKPLVPENCSSDPWAALYDYITPKKGFNEQEFLAKSFNQQLVLNKPPKKEQIKLHL